MVREQVEQMRILLVVWEQELVLRNCLARQLEQGQQTRMKKKVVALEVLVRNS